MQKRIATVGALACALTMFLGVRAEASYTLTIANPAPPSQVFGPSNLTTITLTTSATPQTAGAASNFNTINVGALSTNPGPGLDSGTLSFTQVINILGTGTTPGTEQVTLSGTLNLISGSVNGIVTSLTNAAVTVNNGSGFLVTFAGYAPPSGGSSPGAPNDGNISILVQPTAVPEPASLAMMGVGLVGVGGLMIRRRRSAK